MTDYFDRHVVNGLAVVLTFLLAYCLAAILNRLSQDRYIPSSASRFTCIDGLRGYLALLVFIFHFALTYAWKLTGEWWADGNFYFKLLGQIGVAIFFMITGFLFIYRILRLSKINWPRLYCSRVFRVLPLYIFVMSLVAFIVAIETNFILVSGYKDVVLDVVRWLVFSGGSFNHYEDTKIIISKVDWTLKHEWLFYCSLPLIAFLKNNARMLLILLAFLIIYVAIDVVYFEYRFFFINTRFLIFFLMGGFAAYLKYYYPNDLFGFGRIGWSLIGVMSVLSVAIFFETAYGVMQALLLLVFFLPVVYGNDYFGLLSKRPSRLLGEISYSIYLMHGIILYIVFTMLMPSYVATSEYEQYFMLMPFISLVVILVSYGSFRLIEKPMIGYGRIFYSNNDPYQPKSDYVALLPKAAASENK